MKKSKGLGRGIDALFQDLENLETVDVKDDTVVQIHQLPLNELANSIEQSGVFPKSSYQ